MTSTRLQASSKVSTISRTLGGHGPRKARSASDARAPGRVCVPLPACTPGQSPRGSPRDSLLLRIMRHSALFPVLPVGSPHFRKSTKSQNVEPTTGPGFVCYWVGGGVPWRSKMCAAIGFPEDSGFGVSPSPRLPPHPTLSPYPQAPRPLPGPALVHVDLLPVVSTCA